MNINNEYSSAITVCREEPHWNDSESISQCIALEVIDYLDRNPLLPINWEKYEPYKAMLKDHGYGFKQFVEAIYYPNLNLLKYKALKKLIRELNPLILTVNNRCNLDSEGLLRPATQILINNNTTVDIHEKSINLSNLIATCFNSPQNITSILIISAKATEVLKAYGLQLAEQEATRHMKESRQLLQKKNTCCTIL